MKIGPLLRVTWRDAFVPTDALTTWWDGEELAKFIEEQDFVVETVGFKVWEDRETLILAQTFARRAGKISGIWRIPVGCIVKRERLSPPKRGS